MEFQNRSRVSSGPSVSLKINLPLGRFADMPFSPLDYRYGCADFKAIWSEEGRHSRQLEVERALIWAHSQMGRVSEEEYQQIAAIANVETI